MEKLTETPDRRPLSAAEAKEFAKEHVDAWREVLEIAREVCLNGRADERHRIADRFGIWPIARTMNFDSSNPQAIGIHCETGEFRTARGEPVTDEQIADAAGAACAVDGRVVLRQVQNHLRLH